MPVQMTREEYQKKYGSQPVRMTRAEYEAKYGSKSVIPDTSWKADLKQGWQGALDAFDQGMERIDTASARPTLSGRTLGRLGAGFRFAGDTLGSLGEGAFRALPGGTTVSDTIGNLVSGAVDIAKGVPGAEGITKAYGALPQPVRQTIGDVGNIALGGAGIAGAVTVPTVGGSIVKTTGKAVVNNAPDIITKDVPTLRAEKVTQGYIEQNTRLKSVGNSFTQNTKTITTPEGYKVTITPVDTLAKYNIAPEVDKGTILMGDYAQRTGALGKIRESVESIDDELDTLIQNNTAGIPLDTFKQKIYSVIEKNDDLKRSAKVASTKSKIDSAFEDYKASYGDTLSEAEINEIRKVMNRDWNPDTMDTSRAIGDAAREIVYSVTPDMRAKALLQEQGNILAAKKYADTVNGTKVVGGRIGNYAMRTAGAILGTTFDKVPVVGPMVGMLGGEYAARALQQSQFKSLSAETKALLQKPFQRSNNIVPTKSASMTPNNASIPTIKAQPEAPTQIPSTPLSTGARQDVSSSKSITQKVKDWYKASGLDDERGFIKVPYIRDDIGSYVQSNPRGRLLDVEARELFNIFKDVPTADESAMYVVRQFLSGKGGGGINRTELATALDILRNNAKKIYVAQRPAQRAPSNKSVMPKPKQKAEPKSKEKSLYNKIKDFLFPPGIPRDRGMINPKAIVDDLTGKTSKADDLLTEAKKYDSLEEFVSEFTDSKKHFQILPREYLKKPSIVYRGVSETGEGIGASGGGAAVEGYGLYTNTKKSVAEGYAKASGKNGKVLELDAKNSIPANPIYFRSSDAVRDWVSISSKKLGINPKEFENKIGINNLVTALGHDGIAFDMNGGVTYVKYPKTRSQLTDIWNKAHVSAVPQKAVSATDNLITEAKKYDSLEEFVTSQTGAYHGSSKKITGNIKPSKDGILGEGFYITNDPKVAESFAKSVNVTEGLQFEGLKKISDPSIKPILYSVDINNVKLKELGDADGLMDALRGKNIEHLRKELITQGYDGIALTKRGESVIFPESLKKIKVKQTSQLTDIWNKAHASAVPQKAVSATDNLITEAKKYDSLEEFVKAHSKPTRDLVNIPEQASYEHLKSKSALSKYLKTQSPEVRVIYNSWGKETTTYTYKVPTPDGVITFYYETGEKAASLDNFAEYIKYADWKANDNMSASQIAAALDNGGYTNEAKIAAMENYMRGSVRGGGQDAQTVMSKWASGGDMELDEAVSRALNAKNRHMGGQDEYIQNIKDAGIVVDDATRSDIRSDFSSSKPYKLTDIWNKAHSKSN